MHGLWNKLTGLFSNVAGKFKKWWNKDGADSGHDDVRYVEQENEDAGHDYARYVENVVAPQVGVRQVEDAAPRPVGPRKMTGKRPMIPSASRPMVPEAAGAQSVAPRNKTGKRPMIPSAGRPMVPEAAGAQSVAPRNKTGKRPMIPSASRPMVPEAAGAQSVAPRNKTGKRPMKPSTGRPMVPAFMGAQPAAPIMIPPVRNQKSAVDDPWGYDDFCETHKNELTDYAIQHRSDDGSLVGNAFYDYSLDTEVMADEMKETNTGEAYYQNINKALRGLTEMDQLNARDKEIRNIMHNVLGRARFEAGEGTVLYRGTSVTALGKVLADMVKGGHPEELLGKTITEPGYMSTARELEPALNFIKAKKDNAVLLRIHMKGGEHAMDISDVSYFGEVEKEILFDEGQEMLITGVEPAKTKKSGGIPEEALVLDVEVKQ